MIRFPILLVEDDENDIFFFQRAAKRAGIVHPIQVVRDGQAAIDYCAGTVPDTDRVPNPAPGLIVLDLNLPYRSGFEVLESLRQNPVTRRTPILIFTSSTAEGDVTPAYDHGANSYLVKRATPEDLIELLKLVKGYWLEANLAARM